MDEDYGRAWNKKFAIIDKCVDEGDWMPTGNSAKNLSIGERLYMSFNIWAFLFTVVYYCIKGMWAKASVLLSAFFLIGILMELIQNPLLLLLSNLVLPSVCGALANFDYYHKQRRTEKMWPFLPSAFGEVWFAIAAPLVAGYIYWTILT